MHFQKMERSCFPGYFGRDFSSSHSQNKKKSDEYDENRALIKAIVRCAYVRDFDHRVRAKNSAQLSKLEGAHVKQFEYTVECFVMTSYRV